MELVVVMAGLPAPYHAGEATAAVTSSESDARCRSPAWRSFEQSTIALIRTAHSSPLGANFEYDLAIVRCPLRTIGLRGGGLSHFRSTSGPGLTLITTGTSCGEDCRQAGKQDRGRTDPPFDGPAARP